MDDKNLQTSTLGENNRLLKICTDFSKESFISLCLHGSKVGGYSRQDSDYDILAVVNNYSEGIRYHYIPFLKGNVSILFVDEELFILDIEKGSLGEFVAGRILTPYISLLNPKYLTEKEIILKKRICLEELEEFVIEHGEMSRGLFFKPEFIALSRMKRRMKVYPPLGYSYSKLLLSDRKNENLKWIIKGYIKALKLLENENIIERSDKYFRIKSSFVDEVLKKKNLQRVINIFEYSRRAISSYLATGRAGRVSLDLVSKELTSKIVRSLGSFTWTGSIDPTEYIYIKTSSSYTSLKDETSAIELLNRVKPGKVHLKRLGSAINDVFLAEVDGERLVVKKFSDWYVFKWFTLNIVALGSKTFSVSGKERLSNEYGITKFLEDKGLPIQNIIHVSVPKRTLVKEFIPGITYLDIVRRYINLKDKVNSNIDSPFNKMGKILAVLHSFDVTIGDTKPENILLSNSGDVYILDLEQAKKGGDMSWDVAEFLFYSGHYGLTLNKGIRSITEDFLRGYLEMNGHPQVLIKAASLPYLKVFSFWTPLPILIYLSNKLRTIQS